MSAIEEVNIGSPTQDADGIETALKVWRSNILNTLMIVLAILALPMLGASIAGAIRKPGQWPSVTIFLVVYLAILGLAVLRTLDTRLRVYGLLLVVYLIGILTLVRDGLAGSGREFLIALPVLAIILAGERPGLWLTALSAVTMVVFAVLAHLGWLANWFIYQGNPIDLGSWIAEGISTGIILGVIIVLLLLFNRFQCRIMADAHQVSKQFEESNQNLQDTLKRFGIMLSQINDQARVLGEAFSQLGEFAKQMGYAASQITDTVQRVIQGLQQQTDSIYQNNEAVEMVSHAASDVAIGTQQQAAAVAEASDIASQVYAKFQHIADNATDVQRESKNAAQIARTGMFSVEESIQGMQAIKTKVSESFLKVQEMGNRSTEIDAILETINDIASQTNLLALNAAIEAARAGEHGRGFAVVANEVRRLADRSSAATGEIGEIINTIQQAVAEAVNAMNESAAEVKIGVERANRSGQALGEIIEAVEGIYTLVGKTVSAVQEMSVAYGKLAIAMEAVSAIVIQNNIISVQMTGSAGEMAEAMEQISNVSQDNSAAMGQVAASAQAMRDGLGEVVVSVRSLSNLAETLQELLTQFEMQ
jgi:methyl-accepting chemotaxis protein